MHCDYLVFYEYKNNNLSLSNIKKFNNIQEMKYDKLGR